MDAAEIARLRELNEAATPGPWDYLEAKTLTHIEGGEGSPNWGLHIASIPKKAADNAAYIAAFDPPTTRALLDAAAALEQARKERNTFKVQLEEQLSKASGFKGRATRAINDRRIAENERDAAHQDAKDARALLGEALSTYSLTLANSDLGARIEAMLEKKL